MNKSFIITWIVLLGLTFISVLLSSFNIAYAAILILVLAVIKFIGVAFQFMELKKAHPFWKILLVSFVCLFTVLILLVGTA